MRKFDFSHRMDVVALLFFLVFFLFMAFCNGCTEGDEQPIATFRLEKENFEQWIMVQNLQYLIIEGEHLIHNNDIHTKYFCVDSAYAIDDATLILQIRETLE